MVADPLSRYCLIEPLARSEIGIVYLARDARLERLVAFKLLNPEISRDSARRESVVQWFHRTAPLRHPTIVAPLELGEHVGQLFIAMEYVEGVTLAETLRRGPVAVSRALEWMESLASALEYAHREGVVHGDLNPDNLRVGANGALRVLGFKIWPAESQPLPAGSLSAKTNYESPEQLEGRALDRQSDVFAFGAVFYEMMSGRQAFPGERGPDLVDRILHSAPESLTRLRPDVPPGIIAIVERCLEKDPALRYPGMEQPHRELAVLRQIEQLLADAEAVMSRHRFHHAIAVLKQAQELDPRHPDVSELLERARNAIDREVAERSADTGVAPKSSAQTSPRVDENVQFTVYRPAAIAAERWYPMLVFAHLAARRADASVDEPDPVEQVRQQAKQILGDTASAFRDVRQDSPVPIPAEGYLRLVPLVPGVEFNPPERSFVWLESVHREEFRLRAGRQVNGETARGFVSVYLDGLLIADIAIAIRVESGETEWNEPLPETATPYRRIFASYAHRDTAVVRQFEEYARGFGDRYMRDVIELRAGEVWNRRLGEMIESADIFQLFWSWNSIDSSFVRSEWEHALSLNRPHFIRPVYWEEPLPQRGDLPPPALQALHFARVGLPAYTVPVVPRPAAAPAGGTDAPVDQSKEARRKESERRRVELEVPRADEERRYRRVEEEEERRRAEARRVAEEEHRQREAELLAELEARPAAKDELRRRDAELQRAPHIEPDMPAQAAPPPIQPDAVASPRSSRPAAKQAPHRPTAWLVSILAGAAIGLILMMMWC